MMTISRWRNRTVLLLTESGWDCWGRLIRLRQVLRDTSRRAAACPGHWSATSSPELGALLMSVIGLWAVITTILQDSSLTLFTQLSGQDTSLTGVQDRWFVRTRTYSFAWCSALCYQIQEGRIWDIFSMQGQHRTWYSGASVSFESVKSVMEYNKLLLRQFIPHPWISAWRWFNDMFYKNLRIIISCFALSPEEKIKEQFPSCSKFIVSENWGHYLAVHQTK